MSNILRTTLRYSVQRFGINCLKLTDSVLASRTSPHISQLLSNSFHVNVPSFSQASIDQQIKKIDSDARRNGRISLREVEDVIEEIKSTRSASVSQSLMVIRCCGNLISEELPQKRTQLVQEIWNTLEKLGINLDISHYNALLRVYLENEHPFVPTDLLAELEQKGIEPNRVTYQRFITRYCQMGDIEGATRILQFMREKEMPVNEVVFNALVLGHSRANDMESAEGILNVMRQGGIEPTAETYTILICGYIQQGNMDKVRSLIEECKTKDVYFIDKDYLEMIYHLSLKDLDIDEILSKIRGSAGYNQEAVNYVHKLVSIGKLENALKVVKSMVRSSRLDGTLSPTGGFFVAALVRNDVPVAEIVKYCDKLIEENMNMQALSIAMENSLRLKKESLALDLFRAAKERNVPLRTHYFWPLIVARGTRKDSKGIFDVLSTMTTEFNVPVSSETIRDYVLPFVLNKKTNIPALLIDLKSCGVTTALATSAIVIKLLLSNQISQAAEIASFYRASYSVFLIRKPLVTSFLKTLDADSFTTILKHVAAGIQWRASGMQETSEKGEDEEEPEIPEYRESIGSIVLDVVRQLKSQDTCKATIESVLKLLQEKGVGISSRSAEAIQNQLQDKLTQEISSLLEKLSADDLPNVEQVSGFGMRVSSQKLNEDSMLRLYENMKAKGEVSKSIQKQLFSFYGRNHQLDKLLELKEEMEKSNFVFSNGMYAYIIDSYVEHGKLDEAWQLYKSRCEAEPDFALNPLRMLRLAYEAVKNDQLDKAIEVLSKKAMVGDNPQAAENSPFMTGAVCWRILNHFAEKGDTEKVNQLFDLIVNNEYCTVNNILLGPLIKVHLVNDDLDGALKTFENCCIKYRSTPYKTELAKRFIENENAAALQRLTDLSTDIHGEINSLYDLMLSFLECGRLRQAKKILETPGLRLRQDRLQNACQKYQNSGSIEHLENLLEITKNVGSIDRSDLYYNLLLTYDKAGEPQKGLSLWVQMQESNETPTDEFLILLADILKKNNLAVPFNVPSVTTEAPLRVQQSESRVQMNQVSRELRKMLADGNVDEALNFKQNKKPEQFNNTDLSLLMESLMKQGRYKESKEIYQELVSRGVLPMTRILKFFTINAMIQGDVELLENLKSKLNEKMKTYVMIGNRLGNAYVSSGRAEEYLNKLEKELDSANSKYELEEFLKNFPKGVLFGLLQESPQFLPQVRRIADKCLERDSTYIGPMNVVWLHHLKNNSEEAEKIWTNYLQNSEQSIIFKGFCNRAVEEGNLEAVQKLKGFVERKVSGTPRSIGILYGSMIKILVAQDKVPEAMKVLEDAISTIKLENIMFNALETLKAACISRNIPFNHTLPQAKSSSANDSDSD